MMLFPACRRYRFIPTGVGNAHTIQRRRIYPPVHPHGCGERQNLHRSDIKTNGSSPRVWGTRAYQKLRYSWTRFIPTGVGNATFRRVLTTLQAVHPHGCGERECIYLSDCRCVGSSPRVWGTPSRIPCATSASRFIPTGVGNAFPTYQLQPDEPVHPHGCGERRRYISGSHGWDGSSPRVWGTHYKPGVQTRQPRFIPTGVGNAPRGDNGCPETAVHPHGCGERAHSVDDAKKIFGSSPRVWGTRHVFGFALYYYRFIPTGVGNAWTQGRCRYRKPVHPHGCGERNPSSFIRFATTGSSPRVWGTLIDRIENLGVNRFIPTGVGNACPRSVVVCVFAVHPHGCGERERIEEAGRVSYGSSPRVWGTPPRQLLIPATRRFIPTGVGNAYRRPPSADGSTVHPHGCGERAL